MMMAGVCVASPVLKTHFDDDDDDDDDFSHYCLCHLM